MRTFDLTDGIRSIYENGSFSLPRWERYTDSRMPGITELCRADLQDCLNAGLSFEENYLPVLRVVYEKEQETREITDHFRAVTDRLEETILSVFGRTVDADLVLYLGLCSGAGWAVQLNGRETVLLGVEKILELHWGGLSEMKALILHELGHLYQEQYGVLRREFSTGRDRFLWQLFTEGIAMVFEQETVGDPQFYHQGSQWTSWCAAHLSRIAEAFSGDLDTMSFENQRFFGDWVRFEGQPDTGYYLGARFVRELLTETPFDDLLSWEIGTVRNAFERFCAGIC